MRETLETVMERALLDYHVPTEEQLRRCDQETISILWQNRCIILRLAAAEHLYESDQLRVEARTLFNAMKKEAMTVTPCLLGLMAESGRTTVANGHDERVRCVVSSFNQTRQLLAEVCALFTPELAPLYRAKFASI